MSVAPAFPWQLEYLWAWFLEFSFGLKQDGMGPPTASWVDVEAWCSAMRLDLEPWEKRTMIRLAHLRAVVLSERKPQPQN